MLVEPRMAAFQIKPVRNDDLAGIADFLHRWWDNEGEGVDDERARKDARSVEACLRWLLLENPSNLDFPHHGYCVRDDSGGIRGVLLSFPSTFLAGDQRILGLCSGSFFVDPEVRTGGFYLFRKYLNAEPYSFFFSNTCNRHSSALWEKSGARAVPNSEREFIIPIRHEVILQALLDRRFSGRTRSRALDAAVNAVGRCGNAIPKFLGQSNTLRVEACRDWEKLASLSDRLRSRALITAERSAAFLEWRYGSSSPNHAAEIYVFADGRGNEGWFALGNKMLGPAGQISACVVLDAVWPRGAMSYGQLLPAIFHRVSTRADAIFCLPRPGLDYAQCSRWIVSRRLEAPRVWTLPGKGLDPLDASSLDLVTADGDSGWSNRYRTGLLANTRN